MDNNDNTPSVKPIKPLRCPLTPYQLFSPVSSVFLDNLSQEEQILGLFNLYNQLVESFNGLINMVNQFNDDIQQNAEDIAELREALTTFQTFVGNKLVELASQIVEGDKATLASAKDYTDTKIKELINQNSSWQCPRYGALTAGEYDGLDLTAEEYDNCQLTAYQYDAYGKWYFLGPDGAIYVQFLDEVEIGALQTIFTLRAPPVKSGYKYLFEISLGNFNLNGNNPAHLEIVGNNTLGNSLPITVPNGGSATVCGIFSEPPTLVRGMSDQDTFTAHNAYIKIKPLGEI